MILIFSQRKTYDEWDSEVKQVIFGDVSAGYSQFTSDTSHAIFVHKCNRFDVNFTVFQIMHSLLSSLDEYAASIRPEDENFSLKSLTECVTGSSLSFIRHFLKRFSHAQFVVASSINSLVALTNVTLSLTNFDVQYREAVLSSLCNIVHLSGNGNSLER